ncbi:MAG: arsenite methyltransferase [Patescibacteria group bacterium]|nr:arsenite methyltransferase [Patescibacteria group bacterium]
MIKNSDKIKAVVKQGYAAIATGGSCCCKNQRIASEIGYSKKDIDELAESNLGLGCGNPTAIADIKEGDVVLDLGCGAGFDVFLAQRKVGTTGRVIGIDMTPEMLAKAEINAGKLQVENVEFILGDIESLPLADNSIDIVISNCVINLAPDKTKVFGEINRVLVPGGRVFLSDIVLLEELTPQQQTDEKLLTGCVAGALQKKEYLKSLSEAGFQFVINKENKDISKSQYDGINLASLSIEAWK